MKKIIQDIKIRTMAALAVVGTFVLTSCSMDQTPYSEVVPESYVKDAQSVNTLVMGCYNGLHNVMHYECAMSELRSDNARMYGNNST